MAEWGFLYSKLVHVRLGRFLAPFHGVTALLVEHVVHGAYRQEIQVSNIQPQLHTSEHKQSGCHRPLCLPQFFLAGTVVLMFMPHRSISSGRI